MTMTMGKKILETIKLHYDIEYDDYDIELIDKLESEEDYYENIDGMDFRFIHEDVIDSIHRSALRQSLEECYGLGALPQFIIIDWESTLDTVAEDGYGHCFGHYDLEEMYAEGWYIFRTN